MKKVTRTFFSGLLALVMLVTSVAVTGTTATAEENYIDNSSLMPVWVPDSEVTVDERGTPDWIDDLIMMGCRIATATPEGTFKSAIKVLDHCAEMGINGLWINPVNDNVDGSHGYFNLGPDTIDPRLTGVLGYDEKWRETDYDEGWAIFKEFVDEAHKRNIRIFLDIVSWGVMDGPLTEAHPDWFQLGNGLGGEGSKNFIYDNLDAQEWFAKEVAEVVEKTGVDGLRYDMEPQKFGYGVATEVRRILMEKGIYIASVSEASNERGDTAYDFEQYGITAPDANTPSTYPQNLYLNGYDIVEDVEMGYNHGSSYMQSLDAGGSYKYYTMMLSCHDFYEYAVPNNKLAFGYQAIYAPFIPLWYIGEEWNNTEETMADAGRGSSVLLFGSKLNWEELDEPENREFYESIKEMIRIRRTYREIFSYWPDDHRLSNICSVEVVGQDNLFSYARFAGNTGLLILPNDNAHDKNAEYKVYVPLADMELDYYESYTVTNLMTGKVVAEGTAKEIRSFTTTVEYGDVDVYEVVANGTRNKPVEDTEDTPSDDGSQPGGSVPGESMPAPDEEDNTVGGEPIEDDDDGEEPEDDGSQSDDEYYEDDESYEESDDDTSDDESDDNDKSDDESDDDNSSSDEDEKEDGDEDDDEETQEVVIIHKRKRKKKDSFPWGWVIGGGAAAVVAAGAGVFFVVYKKRKKKEDPAPEETTDET